MIYNDKKYNLYGIKSIWSSPTDLKIIFIIQN